MTKIISVEKTLHKNKPRLKLLFDRDEELINEVKTIKDCRWSATLGCCHIPYYDNHLSFLNRKFNGKIRFLPTQEPADKQAYPSQRAEPSRKVQVPKAFVEQMKIRRFSGNKRNSASYPECYRQ